MGSAILARNLVALSLMLDMREAPPILDLKASLKRPLLWAVGVGVVTALYTLTLPNYYRSESRLLPVDAKSTGNLGNLAAAAAAFGVSVPGGDGGDANFVDVLNSRWLREQLLRTEFQYHVRTWRFGAEKFQKGTLYDYLHQGNMDRAVNALRPVLTVSRDLKSKLITLSAETTSPELSQLVVQRAERLLEDFIQEKGRTRGGAKAAFAEARLRDARREMEEAERTLLEFLEVNRNYQTSGDPSVRLKGSRLEAELRLRQQLVTTLTMSREQALLEEKDDLPILNVLDPGNLPIDKSKPGRASIVLLMSFLAGLASWGWSNRGWIRERLIDDEEGSTSEPDGHHA